MSDSSGQSPQSEEEDKRIMENEYLTYEKTLEARTNNIYKVRNPNNEPFVVKRISNENFREKEVEILKKLNINHVIKLEREFVNNNIHYLVFKYYPTTLNNYLKSSPSQNALKRWLNQICEVFKNLQGENVLYRDIKSDNILLTEESDQADIILIDLGSSTDDSQNSRSIHYSPMYVAPEVLAKNPCTIKSDVWSFGKLIEEMFCRCPLEGLQDIIDWCTQINPENRPCFDQLYSDEFFNAGKKEVPAGRPESSNEGKNLESTKKNQNVDINEYLETSKDFVKLFYLFEYSQPKTLQRIWLNSLNAPILAYFRFRAQQKFEEFHESFSKNNADKKLLDEVKMKASQYQGGSSDPEAFNQFHTLYKASKNRSSQDEKLLSLLESTVK